MSKAFPNKPNLDHLRGQARDLLANFRSNTGTTRHQVYELHPQGSKFINSPEEFCLSDAQLVVARQYGFDSWPKMKAFVDTPTQRDGKPILDLALEHLREGKLCILFDDESRENEGDLVLAAEKVSSEGINFITKHGRGTLCLAMTGDQADRLGLHLINPDRKDLSQPAFMVSIDAAHGVTTGVSAFDRAQTVQTAIADDANPDSIRSPGHIFPLRAHPGGIRARRGHTEGAVDLVRKAGLKPAAVICEILNEDGTMARWFDVISLGERLNIPVVRISDLDT